METNETPKKIYLVKDRNTNKPMDYWYTETTDDSKIEYTRTDAFIEKACEFLSNKANIPLWEGYAYTFGCDTTKLVDNFKNYMKGK